MSEDATKGHFRVYIYVDVLCGNYAHKIVQLFQLSSGRNVKTYYV